MLRRHKIRRPTHLRLRLLRPPLLLLLDQEPDAEIVEAIGRVADADCLIRLRRTAERCPALIGDVIDALELSDDPRAAALVAQLTAPG